MYQQNTTQAKGLAATIATLELIYHLTVRDIRKTHRNAVVGLAMELLQSVTFLGTFYILFTWIGVRSAGLRGDFVLYLMTGIFMFMAHIKALSAVYGAESANGAMMKHRAMNSVVAILGAAIASLYLQILSIFVICTVVHVAFSPLVIDDPYPAFLMIMLSWLSGACIGMIFRGLKPWFPSAMSIARTVYTRFNMIASGKMFVANTLPASMLPWFQWNPLFHSIDQCRGFVFVNYFPRNSNWEYIIWFSLIFLILGVLGEHFAQKNASASLSSRQ